MNKKVKLLIIVLILIVILSGIVYIVINLFDKNIDIDNNNELEIVKKENCKNDIKEYYEFSLGNGRVYFVCIDEINVKGLYNKTLYEFFGNSYNDFEVQLKKITDNMDLVSVYKDGGTKIYKKKDLTIIQCNTLDNNRDVYFGDKNLKFSSDYCKNTDFEMTSTIKKISGESVYINNPNDGESCDYIIHVTNYEEIKEKLKVGLKINIIWNGYVLESCPAQIYARIEITD